MLLTICRYLQELMGLGALLPESWVSWVESWWDGNFNRNLSWMTPWLTLREGFFCSALRFRSPKVCWPATPRKSYQPKACEVALCSVLCLWMNWLWPHVFVTQLVQRVPNKICGGQVIKEPNGLLSGQFTVWLRPNAKSDLRCNSKRGCIAQQLWRCICITWGAPKAAASCFKVLLCKSSTTKSQPSSFASLRSIGIPMDSIADEFST